jgi:hypothetical protein
MVRQYPLNINLNQSGLAWDDRYEYSPLMPPKYPIWLGIVKFL